MSGNIARKIHRHMLHNSKMTPEEYRKLHPARKSHVVIERRLNADIDARAAVLERQLRAAEYRGTLACIINELNQLRYRTVAYLPTGGFQVTAGDKVPRA